MKLWKNTGKSSKKRAEKKVPQIERVAVFGYADAGVRSELYKDVQEVGQALAEAGYVVVDGGGPGVMRAATVGAKLGGGQAIAVTLYPKDMTHFEGRDPKNEFDREIRTSNYLERTLTLLKEGQVYVIFNGGTGTISEFAMAWGMARLYFGHHKPLLLYGKFWKKIIRTFKENMLIRPEEMKVFKIVTSADEVLDAIEEFQKEIERGDHEHDQLSTSDFTL